LTVHDARHKELSPTSLIFIDLVKVVDVALGISYGTSLTAQN